MKMTAVTKPTLTMTLMFLSYLLLCTGIVFSLPVTRTKFDQSQHGELNVRADLDNILIMFIPSGGVRLLDSEQISSIIQIIGSSRKGQLPNGDTSYNVNGEQAALDKLQSDIDTLNSIIPIGKNYNNNNNQNNAENKEMVDEKAIINSGEPADALVKEEVVASSTVEAVPEISTAKTTEELLVSSEAKLSTSASPEITTSEAIITSVPLTKTSTVEKDKQTEGISSLDTANKETEDLSTKLQHRVIGSSSPSKTHVSLSSSSTSDEPKKISSSSSPRAMDVDDREQQQRERQLKALRAGLKHCSPGERLTQDGDCVEIQNIRESRQEKMEQLLSLLRFGVRPAVTGNE